VGQWVRLHPRILKKVLLHQLIFVETVLKRKQGMFCFWCVWGRPSIKDQGANNSFSAEVGELDQCNQSVNLSTCQPKTTAPVTYKPMGRQDAPLTKPTMITANPMTKNNLEAGLSPTSSSCPQLTVEEPTESYHSEEETDHSHVRVHEARKPFKSASSKQQVKTYSFRRMLSFRGSLRGSGSRRSNSTAAEDSASSSPGLQPHHRPLQFSFLGQIYKTRSTKKQQQRRSSSQKVRQQTPVSHLYPSIDDLNSDIDDVTDLTATQAIVEN